MSNAYRHGWHKALNELIAHCEQEAYFVATDQNVYGATEHRSGMAEGYMDAWAKLMKLKKTRWGSKS